MTSEILTADIGGTNARFGIATRNAAGRWKIDHFAKFQGDDYATFESVLAAYLDTLSKAPTHGIFSVAGPVADDKVELTNRGWSLDGAKLAKKFGFKATHLVNDFAAMTRSVPELGPEDLLEIKSGTALENAPILVAGPGTGFGVGYLLPLISGWHVMTTEGGHQAYSPQTEREMDILKILRARLGFISLELVASGSGLPAVHRAVCVRHNVAFTPLSPAVVREKARLGDPVCLEVCEIRAAAVMGAIADMALSGGARGGVVLAGGVSERMIEFLKTDDAMSRFLDRGKRSDYMTEIPIHLLTNPQAALIGGAALYQDLIDLLS